MLAAYISQTTEVHSEDPILKIHFEKTRHCYLQFHPRKLDYRRGSSVGELYNIYEQITEGYDFTTFSTINVPHHERIINTRISFSNIVFIRNHFYLVPKNTVRLLIKIYLLSVDINVVSK